MLSANCEGQIMGMIFQTRSSKANAESWENERNSHLRAIKTWHIRVGKRYLLIETNTFLFVTLTYHQFFTDLALSYLNQGFQGQFDTRLRFLIQQTSMNWYSF